MNDLMLNSSRRSFSTRAHKYLKKAMQCLLGQWIFDLGASIYNALTSNPIWQANCALLLEGMASPSAGLLVLDLGIGPGVSAMSMGEHWPNGRFIGLDISNQMLELAGENRSEAGWRSNRLSLVRGNALCLPFADNTVDAVTGHSFLYLLPDEHTALIEAHRVVRSGGYAAFLEPYAGHVDWSWLIHQKSGRLLLSLALWRFYNWIHGRFSETDIKREFEQVGFSRVKTEVTLGGFGIFGRARKP
jgi:ubiquinone/menaquinone biosynthesis C-methylase UbiE